MSFAAVNDPPSDDQDSLTETDIVAPPRFYNKDTDDNSLPDCLDPYLQPILANVSSGVAGHLARRLEVRVANGVFFSLDWRVDISGVVNIRSPPRDARNYFSAILGQCLGMVVPPNASKCGRCLRNPDACAFASCRVAAFYRVSDDVGMVIAKGACMCCVFSGSAKHCSFRDDCPVWALSYFQKYVPSFVWEPTNTLASAPATPVAPRQQVDLPIHPAAAPATPTAVPATPTAAPATPQAPSTPASAVASAYHSLLTDDLLAAPLAGREQVLLQIDRCRAQLAIDLAAANRDYDLLLWQIQSQRRRDMAVAASRSAAWDAIGEEKDSMDIDGA